MPKRSDIQRILIPGAGPIVIGQACEFDYSGTQACRALRQVGFDLVLFNSNPASIMTDPDLAQATYLEPLQLEYLEAILKKERPDAILPTMGGQTALNLTIEAHEAGLLKHYDVEMIGATPEAISTAEDRSLFSAAMADIGLPTPQSVVVGDLASAEKALEKLGLPCIIRPSFTLGGAGGGIGKTKEEVLEIVCRGLEASRVNEVQMDASLLGWKEFELEVVRDSADNCIIVCSIENFEPMGVHTGDSITVAPAQTLTDREYQQMRNSSIAILRRIGVDTGGANVQFAVCPKTGRQVVVEMNPRVSRSSALASKATGFPIAKVAALLSVGFRLDELRNEITGGATPSSFEPALDYVVTKIPRFDFDKFPGASRTLTTRMQAIGEVMAIGSTFQESLQKALRSMECNWSGLVSPSTPKDTDDDAHVDRETDTDALLQRLRVDNKDDEHILCVAEALRRGMAAAEVAEASMVDIWFVENIADLIREEKRLVAEGRKALTPTRLREVKRKGFSDKRIGELLQMPEEAVQELRKKLDVHPVYRRIDSCAAEFEAPTAYLYSTYESLCEANPTADRKVMVLGSGPNRIGQGIEFDYCCVHAAQALREIGVQTIMINCNPETVSTDYDISDKLYFEPVTAEDVLEIARCEKPDGALVQFGGQTPLRIARRLQESGLNILGTPPDVIHRAEQRDEFRLLVEQLNLLQPKNATASNLEEATSRAKQVGYPLVVRPSYVLGGRAMEIVHNDDELKQYLDAALRVSNGEPVLLDHFLDSAIEVDVEVICDGETATIAAVLEHVEQAGIHSGDSACSLPSWSLSDDMIERIHSQARALALELGVQGLMNAQFAIAEGKLYLLEVNPRASRTVPFVSKVIGHDLAGTAVKASMGKSLREQGFTESCKARISAVKEAVFPFSRFGGVDPYLGPEMRSTGEVMGMGANNAEAYLKSQLAAGHRLPAKGEPRGAFLSTRRLDREQVVPLARNLLALGFRLWATQGTATAIAEAGLPVTPVLKVHEGSPNCLDLLSSGDCNVVVNTAEGTESIRASASIRLTAQALGIYTTTTVWGAMRLCDALPELDHPPRVQSLQSLTPATAPEATER